MLLSFAFKVSLFAFLLPVQRQHFRAAATRLKLPCGPRSTSRLSTGVNRPNSFPLSVYLAASVLTFPVRCFATTCSFVGKNRPPMGFATLRRRHVRPATHTENSISQLRDLLVVSHDLEVFLRTLACGLISCRCHPWVCIRQLLLLHRWISPPVLQVQVGVSPSRISPFESRVIRTVSRGG
jgi:hypothetical protein